MKLSKLFTICILALGLSLPLAACDSGDDGDTADTKAEDSNGAPTEETGEEDTDAPADVDCSTFCTSYVDLCLQTGKSDEFETNDDCLAACDAWDAAGVTCRAGQIAADACDQAGNTGSAC